MWPVSIASAISALRQRLSGSAFPASEKTCPPENAGSFGHATIAETRAKTAALAQRERLIADLREAKRQHRSTKKIRKALCSATNEALNG